MNDLIIDRDFLLLVQNINQEEQERVSTYIRQNNIVPEITVWKQYVVDGFHFYKICKHFQLPYTVKRINLHNRIHAMKWICEKQLSRKDLYKNFEWYLIGKQYIFEQAGCVARYTTEDKSKYEDKRYSIAQEIIIRMATQYGISKTSVLKYSYNMYSYFRWLNLLNLKYKHRLQSPDS